MKCTHHLGYDSHRIGTEVKTNRRIADKRFRSAKSVSLWTLFIALERNRAGSGNLHSGDKWSFCLTSA